MAIECLTSMGRPESGEGFIMACLGPQGSQKPSTEANVSKVPEAGLRNYKSLGNQNSPSDFSHQVRR